MNRLLFIVGLILCSLSAHSQDIYHAVMMRAQDVIDNPASDDNQLRIAQFKVTALNYMHRKMVERNPDTPAHELDEQACYMSDFVTKFLADVYKHRGDSEKERRNRVLGFVQISLSCPMFQDPDKSVTEVFVSGGDSLTPFSLDTDWKKACEMLEAQSESSNKR